MEKILENIERGIKNGVVAAQKNKTFEIEKNVVLEKMKTIENDIRLTLEFQEDAREQWPARWVKLKSWLTMYGEDINT